MATKKKDIKPVIAFLGGPSALARALHLNGPSVVTNWYPRNQIPTAYMDDIERLTGGRFDRYYLRPDVYGRRPRKQAAA